MKSNLVEESKVIITHEAVAEKLSSYLDSTLSDIIRKFENHPRIMKMKENTNKHTNKFSFSLVTKYEVEKKINLLDISLFQCHNERYEKIEIISQTLLLITLTEEALSEGFLLLLKWLK